MIFVQFKNSMIEKFPKFVRNIEILPKSEPIKTYLLTLKQTIGDPFIDGHFIPDLLYNNPSTISSER